MREPKRKSVGREMIGILVVAFLALTGTDLSASADEKIEKVDRLFAEWDRTTSPGAVLAVIQDGKVVYERGYGMAKLEDDLVMTPDKVFNAASMAKQFTAACLAFLVKDGKVSVSDDIRKHVPEFPVYERTVTIDHLLHHTSGIRDTNALLDLAGFRRDSDCPTTAEALEIICRQKALNFLPGDAFSYSNSGYFLLGLIVARVSGVSLNEFAREHIFKPLGMSHTFFQDDHNRIVKNGASAYSAEGNGYRLSMSPWGLVGSGNLCTTVGDMALWDQAFTSGRLGPVTDMIQTVGALNSGRPNDYAWGLIVGEHKGLKTVSHGGNVLGFRSDMFRFPEQRFSVICLANLDSFDPTSLCLRVADIYLAPLLKEPPRAAVPKAGPVTLPPGDLEAFAGNYYDREDGVWMSLKVKDKGLFVGELGVDCIVRPVSRTRFEGTMDDGTGIVLDFPPAEDGTPRKARLVFAGDNVPFEFRQTPAVRPLDEASLVEYAGTYSSPELLDAVYSLILEKGNLRIKFRNAPRSALKLMAPERFKAGRLTLEFLRDKQGRVSGMTLSSGRAKGIVFTKAKERVPEAFSAKEGRRASQKAGDTSS